MTAGPHASLQARLDALYARRARGIKLGLDNVAALLEELGRPQDALAPIHVAGTNGKGSVCAMLEAVLRAAGMKPGLYTSPHLIRFNERIRVNGVPIRDKDLLALLEDVDRADELVAGRPGLRRCTFFEFTTVAALAWFQRTGARLAVLETGLGGRLDATNVVQPLAVVLTAMAKDHTEYLGSDIESITAEKAAIIKPGRPVICGLMVDPARRIVEAAARAAGAPLVDVRDAVSVKALSADLDGQKVKVETASTSYRPFTLPLLGHHQLENLAAVMATVDYLNDAGILHLPEDVVRQGLEGVDWPGRLQVLERDPPVLLDAAHNPAGAEALADTLRRVLPDRPIGLVAGLADDKDAAGFMRHFASKAVRCWAVPLNNPRGRPAEETRSIAEAAGLKAVASTLPEAMEQAGDWAVANEGTVIIAGSIYLAGEVLALRDAGPNWGQP